MEIRTGNLPQFKLEKRIKKRYFQLKKESGRGYQKAEYLEIASRRVII